jgi:hypothetical protein
MYEETDPPSTGMDTKTGKSAGNGEVSTPLIPPDVVVDTLITGEDIISEFPA